MRVFAGLCNIYLCSSIKIVHLFANKWKTFMIYTKALIIMRVSAGFN